MTPTAGLEHLDAWRGPPARGPWREWQHFIICAEGVELLINFSCAFEAGRLEDARLILLAWSGTWSGRVCHHAPERVRLRPGRIDVALGRDRLAFRDGTYRLQVSDRALGLHADLCLRPRTLPAVVQNISLAPGAPLGWLILPHLEVSGLLRVGDRSCPLRHGAAYHDHNWGRFRFGEDFGWEWGQLRSDRLNLVFSRTCDRGGFQVWNQELLVWADSKLVALFHREDLEVYLDGTVTGSALDLPPEMSLLAPGSATGAPASVQIVASRGEMWLQLHLSCQSLARLLIPSQTAPEGVVRLNEVPVVGALSGRLGTLEICEEVTGVFEFVR